MNKIKPMENPGIDLARELTIAHLTVLDAALRKDQKRREADKIIDKKVIKKEEICQYDK